MLLPKVKLVYFMRHVKIRSDSLQLTLHVVVEICMATYVKVPRHLLHGKGTYKSASVMVFKSLLHLLQLLAWVLLVQQLERALVDKVALRVQSPFLY